MNLIDFIFKWQTLLGGIIGGIIALLAALIVAWNVRRREDVSAAMLVLTDLAEVRIASEALIYLSTEDKISDDDFPLWFSEQLVYSHPSLSTLFEASVSRLMPVDVTLASHLSLFHKIYSKITVILDRLKIDYDKYHKTGKPLRSSDHLRSDCKLVAKHFKRVVSHSECAEHLIFVTILSKFSFLHKLRRKVFMKKQEKECLNILKGKS